MLSFFELTQNTATVCLAAVLIALLGDQLRPLKMGSQALIGLIFGAAGLLSMAHSAVITEGFFFDGRIVVVALAGPVGGPLAAVLTAGIVAGMRLAQGGVGALVGIAGIALAAVGGILFQKYLVQKQRPLAIRDLFLVGALAAAIPFLSLPFLGDANLILQLLGGASSVTAITNLLGTVFAGLIIVRDRDRRAMALDLKRAYEAAQSANSAKNSFLAHLSHEFRSPLTSVLAGLHLIISQKHGALGDPRYVEYAQMMRRSVLHLTSLIEDILDMSSIEAGKISLQKHEVKLAEIIRDVVEIMRARAETAGISLDATENPDCLLYVDIKRIRQTLINLVTNALRFTPRGGRVRLSVVETVDARCRIIVSDTGVGIAAAELQRVLEPYGQVKNEINRQGGGSGLGLPLSKRLVELHSGTLSIESEPGRGTSVTIDLPRGVCTENLNPNVMVMKSAKDGVRFDASGPLNCAREVVPVV